MKHKFYLFFFIFFMIAGQVIAQQTNKNVVEMADFMRSSGRIYVVIAVLLTILLGLLLYLVRLDKKIKKLENGQSQ